MRLPRSLPFIGIVEDLKSRLPLYSSDFTDFWNLKVSASILFMFFTSIGPAITFANLLQKSTDNQVGVMEVLLSSAICGIFFSLFAGQPIVIVGVTGPISILTIGISTIASQWSIPFLPFYGWAQVWACIIQCLMAITNCCDIVSYISRFSCEIFGVLIALIYIYSGLHEMFTAFDGESKFEKGIFQLFISFGMLWTSQQLSSAKSWVFFTANIRDIISDYGTSMSLILWTGIVYCPVASKVGVDTLQVPKTFETSTKRSWLVDLSDLPTWAIFAAILPGFIIAVLFFFDHNVSSLMAQDPQFKLKKPSTFHWDFFICGLSILLTGLLGIPPTNGLIPQAPLHTQSLLIRKPISLKSPTSIVYNSSLENLTGNQNEISMTTSDDNNINNNNDNSNDNFNDNEVHEQDQYEVKLEIVGVHEQRVSNLMMSVLIGICCFNPFLSILGLIPTSALSGLFLFMGLASFQGNQFVERLLLNVTDPIVRARKLRSSTSIRFISFTEIRKFTYLQLLICLIIFGITFTQATMVFPVLIGVLIPLRLFVLPLVFSSEALASLDPITDSEECPSQSTTARREGQSDSLENLT